MAILVFIFGLIIGSFLNVVIFRLHSGKNLGGRSKCPKCHRVIAWYDNIPVLSFCVLRGKCRHCKKLISWQYPLVEFTSGLLFLLAYGAIFFKNPVSCLLSLVSCLQYPISHIQYLTLFRDLVFISFLIIIFVYDLRWMYILDRVTLPAGIVAIIANLYLGFDWKDLIFGATIGGGFFFVQYILSRGQWIGGGDIRLGVVMGLMLGWQGVLLALLLAYVSGALVALGLLASRKKKMSSQIPFGTFLSVATIMALLYGKSLLAWYF